MPSNLSGNATSLALTCWENFHDFCRLLIFFKINLFSKTISGTQLMCQTVKREIRPEKFGPDLDPNCLQRLSADNTGR